MIRWLKNRKEKREKRRQDKHRRVLNALKARGTTGSTSDYGFYSEEFMQNCESETTPHDYEEINEMSVSNILPQFTKIVGTDFRFGTYITDQPPQLPARGFLTSSRSVSVSSCKDNSAEDKLRARTVSLPSFERPGHFPILTDADEEPSYHEPWDCKTNLILKCATENGFNGDSQEVIQLRLYEKVIKRNIAIERKNNSRWSRNSVESQIYSEIEDSDTGCESDTLSQSESESSVFIKVDSIHSKNQKCNTLSNDIDEDYASDSDASSGFCEGLTEIDEDHKKVLMKCLGNPENAISSPSLFRRRYNTLPCSPCPKICEDADLYLVPKRRHSLGETTTEKLDLPVQKKKYKMEQRKIGRKNRNRLLEDLIWRNNFKQDVSTL